jgi:uncharacterized protein
MDRRPRTSDGAQPVIELIDQHLEAIRALCRRHGVRRLDLFGSAATGAFDPATSDLDFVATFADTNAPDYAERFLDFAEALEALFGRQVDVVIDRSIRDPHFRRAVDATRQPVYDDRDAPAAA